MRLGRNFRERGPRNQKSSPLPQSSLFVDFDHQVFAWGGAPKAITDLVHNADGSYTLLGAEWWGNSISILIEFDYDFSAAPTGNLLSWTSDGLERFEIETLDNGAFGYTARVYTNSSYTNFVSVHPNDTAFTLGKGRRRLMISGVPGSKLLTLAENYVPADSDGPLFQNYGTPSKLNFGSRARFGDQPLTHGTLHKVVIWPSALTASEMEAAILIGARTPIHFVGDSFLNTNVLLEQTVLPTKNSDYLPFSQDGAGGTSLTQQAVRFASPYTKWWKSTLIIVDGGFDGTGAEAVAAIHDMVARLPHERWLYVESNPAQPYLNGDLSANTERLVWDAKTATVLAYAGEAHFVHTLSAIQAANNGSSGDIDDISPPHMLWPRSLRLDDYHLNPAGDAVLGQVISAALLSRGWI